MDWIWNFRDVARVLVHGGNPYLLDSVVATPPWLLLLLVPFVGDDDGLVYMACTAAVTIVAVWLLADKKLSPTIAYLLSPLTLGMMWQRNLEWLVLLGIAIDGKWSLLLLPAKPHLCAATIVRRSLRNPALVVLVGSLTLFTVEAYGAWFCSDYGYMLAGDWNFSLWPWTVPLGLFFLVAFREDHVGQNVGVMLLLPYLPTYSIALLGLPLLASPRLAWLGTGFLWLLLCLVWLTAP